MDELRENIQLEKLRALKPVADLADQNQNPVRKLGLSSTKIDPKAMGKELQEEVRASLLHLMRLSFSTCS